MAIASILTSGMMYVMADGPAVVCQGLLPLLCLGGPLSLLFDIDAALRVLRQAGGSFGPRLATALEP